MVDRSRWNSVAEELEEIASHYSEEVFDRKIKETSIKLENFDIKLLFVGAYNAGKSSLLNALVGREELLGEGIVPETDVATELRYGKDECLKIISEEGEESTVSIGTSFDSEGIEHVEYTLDSESLMELSDYTIVDTPGIESGRIAHEKAIQRYIAYGSCFVVVMNVEDGTVKNSLLRFVEGISMRGGDMVFLINKTDKKPAKEVQEIYEYVKETLSDNEIECEVFCVSKHDADITEKLIQAISVLDAQKAFDRQAKKRLLEVINTYSSLLDNKNKYMDELSTFEFDIEMNKALRMKEQIEEAFDDKKRELNEELEDKIDLLNSNLKNALYACENDIVKAVLSGGNEETIQAIVSERIRPLITDYITEYSMENIDDLLNRVNNIPKGDELKEGVLERIYESMSATKDMLQDGNYITTVPTDGSDETDKSKDIDGKMIYESVMVPLSLLTDVVAPWLEAALIVAPFILDMIGPLRKQKAIADKYRDVTVPEIIHKLHEPLCDAMKKSNQSLIDALYKNVDTIIQDTEDIIRDIQKKKNAAIEDHENYKNTIIDDIERLNDLKCEVSK